MDILGAAIGIVGLVISGIGVYYTWRTFTNTTSIKESVKTEVQRVSFYSELSDLIDKVNECELKALSPDKPFDADHELITGLRYICDRLQKHLSDDDENANDVKKIIDDFERLRTAPSSRPSLQTDYGVLIKDIKSILKSGRS